eukprot:CAMPEP_0182559664 /NCGR_PEP_ID=MMETSP1324-20130603/2698_1 /TAXON_ID=236786 /ORGANISM="Florenciella sp., Strain RCC1587" /LENGTH=243 /DNA_ID=CAMNT_0024771945 /DNA_START=66 /DNA_END=798 /DNA_ORIENTATION=-
MMGVNHLKQKAKQRDEAPRKRALSAGDIRPPFPAPVVKLLDSASLCYLSTTHGGAPHLSLMHFTYVQHEELIVFTTRRNTLKHRNLVKSPDVAILIHDFPGLTSEGQVLDGEGGEKTYSRTYAVTLYGRAYVLEEGSDSERLREKHLARQPESAVFIKGDDIAVVTVLSIQHGYVTPRTKSPNGVPRGSDSLGDVYPNELTTGDRGRIPRRGPSDVARAHRGGITAGLWLCQTDWAQGPVLVV